MPTTKESISIEIRRAFHRVTLGNGIGLLQGQGLDDYADAATCKRYRDNDEKLDWEKIPIDALNRCYSSLSFFDAAGMRFHLPAFLIAELNRNLGADIVFHLTHLDDFAKSKLIMLSRKQREAVRKFLLFIKPDPNYEFDRSDIERALADYWQNDGDERES